MTDTTRRITFYWNTHTIGFYGQDQHGTGWSTSMSSTSEPCAICGSPISGGYRSEHNALVCAEHVDFVTVTAIPPLDDAPDDYDATVTWEIRAWHLNDGRRVQWEYVDKGQAQAAFDHQVKLAEEAAAAVTMSLIEIRRPGDRETYLSVY